MKKTIQLRGKVWQVNMSGSELQNVNNNTDTLDFDDLNKEEESHVVSLFRPAVPFIEL